MNSAHFKNPQFWVIIYFPVSLVFYEYSINRNSCPIVKTMALSSSNRNSARLGYPQCRILKKCPFFHPLLCFLTFLPTNTVKFNDTKFVFNQLFIKLIIFSELLHNLLLCDTLLLWYFTLNCKLFKFSDNNLSK